MWRIRRHIKSKFDGSSPHFETLTRRYGCMVATEGGHEEKVEEDHKGDGKGNAKEEDGGFHDPFARNNFKLK